MASPPVLPRSGSSVRKHPDAPQLAEGLAGGVGCKSILQIYRSALLTGNTLVFHDAKAPKSRNKAVKLWHCHGSRGCRPGLFKNGPETDLVRAERAKAGIHLGRWG